MVVQNIGPYDHALEDPKQIFLNIFNNFLTDNEKTLNMQIRILHFVENYLWKNFQESFCFEIVVV